MNRSKRCAAQAFDSESNKPKVICEAFAVYPTYNVYQITIEKPLCHVGPTPLGLLTRTLPIPLEALSQRSGHSTGTVAESIEPGSLAHEAGLMPNDVVCRIAPSNDERPLMIPHGTTQDFVDYIQLLQQKLVFSFFVARGRDRGPTVIGKAGHVGADHPIAGQMLVDSEATVHATSTEQILYLATCRKERAAGVVGGIDTDTIDAPSNMDVVIGLLPNHPANVAYYATLALHVESYRRAPPVQKDAVVQRVLHQVCHAGGRLVKPHPNGRFRVLSADQAFVIVKRALADTNRRHDIRLPNQGSKSVTRANLGPTEHGDSSSYSTQIGTRVNPENLMAKRKRRHERMDGTKQRRDDSETDEPEANSSRMDCRVGLLTESDPNKSTLDRVLLQTVPNSKRTEQATTSSTPCLPNEENPSTSEVNDDPGNQRTSSSTLSLPQRQTELQSINEVEHKAFFRRNVVLNLWLLFYR